jgi:hypothetical protein
MFAFAVVALLAVGGASAGRKAAHLPPPTAAKTPNPKVSGSAPQQIAAKPAAKPRPPPVPVPEAPLWPPASRRMFVKIISLCVVMAGVAVVITVLFASFCDCAEDQNEQPAASHLRLVSA